MIFLILSGCMTLKPMIMYDFAMAPTPRCRVNCYNYNKMKIIKDWKCGPNFVSGNYPIEKCHGIFGISKKNFAEELKPKVKLNIEYTQDLEDRCER